MFLFQMVIAKEKAQHKQNKTNPNNKSLRLTISHFSLNINCWMTFANWDKICIQDNSSPLLVKLVRALTISLYAIKFQCE